MEVKKREKLINRIEEHLRKTARQLVKFDTEEETLQYLTDSFRTDLNCDFVGIILKEGENFIPKVLSGGSDTLTESFPLKIADCSSELLTQGLTFQNADGESACALSNLLWKEKITSWVTFPLKDELNSFGLCIIGFMNFVPLYPEMDKQFVEFGKDISVAMTLAKQKEAHKTKIMGVEWISKNLFLDSSIEKVVEKIVEHAGKGTNAQIACIYLYNENKNCFMFQPPSYGEISESKKIIVENNYMLKEYFPYLESPGGNQLTVPLVVELKTIGVLHVENKNKGVFTYADLEILELLSRHVAAMIENARLYNNEKAHKQRLHSLLEYQQHLVKQTVEEDNFDGISLTISKLFSKSVILFDRFMRPISYHLCQLDETDVQSIVKIATLQVLRRKNRELSFSLNNRESTSITIWPVNGGGDLLGYLALDVASAEIDDFNRLSIDVARNIYSIQFIKQKLVFDAKEQVKDSFINKLLVEKIEDKESIIQYANLFQWDLFNQHRVSVVSISLDESQEKKSNILEQQAQKAYLWEQLKIRLSIFDSDILLAHKGDEYILIVPAIKENNNPKKYWTDLFERCKKWLESENASSRIFLGVGGKTEELNDYYICYEQAIQAINVVIHGFKYMGFAIFDELGAYTLLHNLKNSSVPKLFIKRHLDPLLHYSEGKSMDLFRTLRVYLNNNGSLKDTSDELYIHRSTLQYRLEKIQSLLEINLDHSEARFNLMLAYKLYDLYSKIYGK